MSNYYIPVLKWKRGEQVALQNLKATTKDNIIPLVEIPSIDYDWVNERPKKSIDDHVRGFCQQIHTSWKDRLAFVDFKYIDDEGFLANGTHPIVSIFSSARTFGLNLIPVVSFDVSEDYKNAIKHLLDNNIISKICIRIKSTDFPNINSLLANILDFLNVSSAQCHIVIDLKEIRANDVPTNQIVVPVIINNIININEWITITLSGSAFPQTLTSVSANSMDFLPRYDFSLWNTLNNSGNLSRYVQYGDYCISHPEINDVDPRLMSMSGNLRYTKNSDFLVIKGVNVRRNGFNQMRDICSQLITSNNFLGRDLSWGDEYIEDCSIGSASTGNAETWRRVGTNHHIELIVSQLSNQSYF